MNESKPPFPQHTRNFTGAVTTLRQVKQAEPVAAPDEVARLKGENDAIAGLNQDQFLELEYLRRVHKAAHQLYMESEEYEFDDGTGRGAQQGWWDALSDAFEPETEAIAEVIAAAPAAPQSPQRDPDALVKQMVAHGINKHLARAMVHSWLAAPGREG